MATSYKKILVPIDGSKQSHDALSEAEVIAHWSEGELMLITVKDIARPYGLVHANVGLAETIELDKKAHDLLIKAAEQVNTDINVKTEVLSGSPKREIVQYAKNNNIDLIVMGSTGAGIIDNLFVGSTTHYVVNHAPCKVTIVP